MEKNIHKSNFLGFASLTLFPWEVSSELLSNTLPKPLVKNNMSMTETHSYTEFPAVNWGIANVVTFFLLSISI